jgi:hypothetical protein
MVPAFNKQNKINPHAPTNKPPNLIQKTTLKEHMMKIFNLQNPQTFHFMCVNNDTLMG